MNLDDDEDQNDELLCLAAATTEMFKKPTIDDRRDQHEEGETSPIVVSQIPPTNPSQMAPLMTRIENSIDHIIDELGVFSNPCIQQQSPQVLKANETNKENIGSTVTNRIKHLNVKPTTTSTSTPIRFKTKACEAENSSYVGMTQALDLLNSTKKTQALLQSPYETAAVLRKKKQFNMQSNLMDLFNSNEDYNDNQASSSKPPTALNNYEDDDLNGIDWNDLNNLETSIKVLNKSDNSGINMKKPSDMARKSDSIIFEKSVRQLETSNWNRNSHNDDDEIFEIKTKKVKVDNKFVYSF